MSEYCQLGAFAGTDGTTLFNQCAALAVNTDGTNLYNATISGNFDSGLVRLDEPALYSTASTPFIDFGSGGNKGFEIQLVGNVYVCQRYQVDDLLSSLDDFQWVRAYNATTGELIQTLSDETGTFDVVPMKILRYSNRYVLFQTGLINNNFPDVIVYDALNNTTSVSTNPLFTGSNRRNLTTPYISADGTVVVRSGFAQTFDPPSQYYFCNYSINGATPVELRAAQWTDIGPISDVSFDGRYLLAEVGFSANGYTVYDLVGGVTIGTFPLNPIMSEMHFIQATYNIIGFRNDVTNTVIYRLQGVDNINNNFQIVPGVSGTTWIYSLDTFSQDHIVVSTRDITSPNNIVTTSVSSDGGTTFEPVFYRNTFNSATFPIAISPSWFTESNQTMATFERVTSDPPGVDNRDFFKFWDARTGNRLDTDIKFYDGVSGGDPMVLLDNGVVIAGPVADPVWTSRTTDTVTLNNQSYARAIELQTNITTPDSGVIQRWTSPNGVYMLEFDGAEFRLFQNVANLPQYIAFIQNTARPNSSYLDEAEATYANVYSAEVSFSADRRTTCSSPARSVDYIYGPELSTTNPSLYLNVLPTSLCLNKNSVEFRSSSEQSLIANFVKRQTCPTELVICTSTVNVIEGTIGGDFTEEQNCGNQGCVATTDCGVGQACVAGTCRDTCTVTTATCNCDSVTKTCTVGSGGGGGGGGGGDDGGLETWAYALIGVGAALVVIMVIVLSVLGSQGKLPFQQSQSAVAPEPDGAPETAATPEYTVEDQPMY